MKHSFFSIISGLLISAAPLSSAATDVQVAPGQLGDILSANTPAGSLILRGSADARDLTLLRTVSGVELLDLSATSIAAVETDTPVISGRSQFAANHLPAYILFDAPYTKVILPASLSAIEPGAMAGSSVTEIEIPEGVTAIGDFAFYGCRNLRKVVLPQSLLSIGRGAFAECPALESINLEATRVTTLPQECLAGARSLRTLNGAGLLAIGTRALARSGVERLDLPDARSMEPFALADMYDLIILNAGPNTVFSEGALMNCSSLTSISGMPDHLPDLFAANCQALGNATILANSSTVGRYALANSGAANLVLGPSLSLLDENALKGMAALAHIDATALDDNPPAAASNAFDGMEPAKIRLKVADHTEPLWQAHPVWGQFDIYSDYLTGVDSAIADAASDIRVTIHGSVLTVIAPQPIQDAAIYDASGALLLTLPAGSDTAQADIASLPKGIAIVSVRTPDHFRGIKIIL